MTGRHLDTTQDTTPEVGPRSLLAWAGERRASARELRRQAELMRRRAAADRIALRARFAAAVDGAQLLSRLATAERKTAHMQLALISNRRIGMALGILMVRHRLTEDQAFELLRDHSNRRNVKLAALAEEITYTGDLPRLAVGA